MRRNGRPGSAPELTFSIKPFSDDGACIHEHESPAYRPPDLLRHRVTIRYRCCSYPGCGRRAQRCDLDHTIPYDQGGRTCECNLAPLCRRHHQAKQTQGWHLERADDHVLTWTLPHGRCYRAGPASYPAG